MAQANEIRVQLSRTDNQIWGLEFSTTVSGEIQVRKIIDQTPASHSNVELGDILLYVNEKNVTRMSLEETASYFKNINVADLVFRRVLQSTGVIQQSGLPRSTSRDIVDLVVDDMGSRAVVAASRPVVTYSAGSTRTPVAPPSLSSTGRRQPEVIDLLSSDDESDANSSSRPTTAVVASSAPPLRGISHTYTFGGNMSTQQPSIPPMPRPGGFGSATGDNVGGSGGHVPLRTPFGSANLSSSNTSVNHSTPSVGGAKRSFASHTENTSSSVSAATGGQPSRKRTRFGSVEVKAELSREARAFGEANCGDDVVEVSCSAEDEQSGKHSASKPTSAVKASSGGSAQMNLDEDDEDFIEILGGNFTSATDYPHQREACTKHPFATLNKNPQQMPMNINKCDFCYCYVCDINARDCCEWSEHCHASYKEPRWKAEKEARNSKIMSLMSPVNKAAFFSANKAYLSSNNSKNALGIRRFYNGGASSGGYGQGGEHESDPFSNFLVSSYNPGQSSSSSSSGNGGLIGGVRISPQDLEVANAMKDAVRTKLQSSQNIVGGSKEEELAATQQFLEASALLLKLLLTPTFPAWDLDQVPALLVSLILHSRCSKDVRVIYRDEMKTISYSRTFSIAFRHVLRLLELADLDYTWLKAKPAAQSTGLPKPTECVLPQDLMQLMYEPIVSLLFGELCAQSRYDEVLAILAVKNDNILRLKAVHSLLEIGGARRNEIAVEVVSAVDSNDFWASCFALNSAGDARALFSRLSSDKLLLFLCVFIDAHLSPSASFRIIRAEGSFESFFHLLLSRLFQTVRDVEVPEVANFVQQFTGPQPPQTVTSWLQALTAKKSLLIMSRTELAAVGVVLLLIYVRRRVLSSKANSLADCKNLIGAHVGKCISGSSTVLCVVASNAILQCSWGLTSQHSELVKALDMELFVGGEVARKVFSGTVYDSAVHQLIDARIREEWCRLPTFSAREAVAGNAALRTYLLEDNKRLGSKGARQIQLQFPRSSDLLPSLLYPATVPTSMQAYQLLGNHLKYGTIYYIVRYLSKRAARAVSTQATLQLFVQQNLESLQMAWKGFLLNSYIFMHDQSPDAPSKYTMLHDFASKMRELVNHFYPPRSDSDCGLECSQLDVWLQQCSDSSIAEVNVMCVNMHAVAMLGLLDINFANPGSARNKLHVLSGTKRFFLTSLPCAPVAASKFHRQYLLGHACDTLTETWTLFWAPLLRTVKARLCSAEFMPMLNVLLEDWEALRAGLRVPMGGLTGGQALLVKIGEQLSVEDFDAIAGREQSAAELVQVVETVCREDATSVSRISDIVVAHDRSMLAAVARRLSADIVGKAAMDFCPAFALIVRDWRPAESLTPVSAGWTTKHEIHAQVTSFYSTFVQVLKQQVGASYTNFEKIVLSFAFLGRFDLVSFMLAFGFEHYSLPTSFSPGAVDSSDVKRATLLSNILMQCESQEEFESAIRMYDSYLAACYLDEHTPQVMQPLINKFSQKYATPGSAFLLLQFYHRCDEDSFSAYWAAVPHTDEEDQRIASFLAKIGSSRRLNTRNHFCVMRRFSDEEDFVTYLSELNVRNHSFDKEEAVLTFLEMAASSPHLKPVLFLVSARFVLNMSSLTARVREALCGIGRDSLMEVQHSAGSHQFGNFRQTVGIRSESDVEEDSVSLSAAVDLLLFITNPAEHEPLQRLKAGHNFDKLKSRVFHLLRDFAHPAPIISLLLQDGEFQQLRDFLVELIASESDLHCGQLCAAINQLSVSITARSIAPRDGVLEVSEEGVAVPSKEQLHQEFFSSSGLLRLVGSFLALAAEKAALKDLSAPHFLENSKQIAASLSGMIKAVLDLTAGDLLIFSFLKLCTEFSAQNIAAFVRNCSQNGYLGVTVSSSPADSVDPFEDILSDLSKMEDSHVSRAAPAHSTLPDTVSSTSSSGAAVDKAAVRSGSLSRMLESELNEDDEEVAVVTGSSAASESMPAIAKQKSGAPVNRLAVVDDIVRQLALTRSNYMSTMRRMDELFSFVAASAHSAPDALLPCLHDATKFGELIQQLFDKPTVVLDETVFSVSTVEVAKGILWIPTEQCADGHKVVLSTLLVLVNKHKTVAVVPMEAPLLRRLDHPHGGKSGPLAGVAPSNQLKNPFIRDLVRGASRLNADCRVAWLALSAAVNVAELYSFDQLSAALPVAMFKPAFASWLSIMSAVVTHHIVKGGVATAETFRVLFFEFEVGGIRRNIFGAERTAELMTHMCTVRQTESKRELGVTGRLAHSRADIVKYPLLLRLVTTDLPSPLYEFQHYAPLWAELIRVPAAREIFPPMLQETCHKVALYVSTERLSARCKALLEEFLTSYRRLFVSFGPGANAAVQAAKQTMRATLKNKPAAVKLLAILDEPISEDV